MPVQFNPYPSQMQNVSANPFAQRGEDQLRKTNEAAQQDRNPTEVRAQSTSPAESQPTETRNAQTRQAARDTSEDDTPRGNQQRGSNLDITV